MQSHSDSVIAPPRFPLFNHSADNFLLSLKPTVVVVAHDVDEVEVFVHLRHVVGSERGCWGCTWMPIKDVLRMFLPLLRLSIGSDQEVLLLLCGWGGDELENFTDSKKAQNIVCLFTYMSMNTVHKFTYMSKTTYMSMVALPAPMAAVRRYLWGVNACKLKSIELCF